MMVVVTLELGKNSARVPFTVAQQMIKALAAQRTESAQVMTAVIALNCGFILHEPSPYRGLAVRLPALAWQRLRLTVLFVSKDVAGQYTVRRVTTPS